MQRADNDGRWSKEHVFKRALFKKKPPVAMSEAIGFVGAAIAVVFFGTYAVPTKLFDTKDGLFFQWVPFPLSANLQLLLTISFRLSVQESYL